MISAKQDIKTVLGVTPRRGAIWRWIVFALVVLTLGLVAWYWLAQSGRGDQAIYATTPAAIGDLTVAVTATGTVEPTNQVDISSELSGIVRAVKVNFNDKVVVGQELAQLDTDKLEASAARSRAVLSARQAQVAQAEATVQETLAQLERSQELAERNVTAAQTLQSSVATHARAMAALAVARAEVEVAEADLRSDETNLAKACICSPINGVVLERNVEVGQVVASTLQAPVLFTIAEDLAEMELRVDIDEADVGKVHLNQPATFTVEAYQGRTFPAKIAELRYAPQTVEGVVTYKAILSIDNAQLLLRPGMTATADIIVDEVTQALIVPNAALRFTPPVEEQGTGGGGLLGLLMPRRPSSQSTSTTEPSGQGMHTIWVLRDGRPAPVTVRTGSTDGLMTVIVEGTLAPGDPVITDLAGE
ncbi:MAG: efflux RND transporter periplasmic adaptor subunit [Flavobacteriaceae bacterium]